jgi:hypothetical protein
LELEGRVRSLFVDPCDIQCSLSICWEFFAVLFSLKGCFVGSLLFIINVIRQVCMQHAVTSLVKVQITQIILALIYGI